MPRTVVQKYRELQRSGSIANDPLQLALAQRLDDLVVALTERRLKSKKSSLGWLFAKGRKPDPITGLYIWGAVGRGKTMLMDLFFETAPGERKRRVHFHDFMADVHNRMAVHRKTTKTDKARDADPVIPLAREIASETRLLCFDEFSVTDIADAMILGRLFEQLFAHGTVLVATSNTGPDDLYEGGLNRALFLPFIQLLKAHVDVFHLDAPRDYRMEKLAADRRYLTPLGTATQTRMREAFHAVAGPGAATEITYLGRAIPIPLAGRGAAWFDFDDLCRKPLGAGDYGMIAKRFGTLFLSNVPVLTQAERNEARRFINLIDVLYDSEIALIVSAAAEPDQLWTGTTGHETAEFRRTASRLIEMRSQDYLARIDSRRLRHAAVT